MIDMDNFESDNTSNTSSLAGLHCAQLAGMFMEQNSIQLANYNNMIN
jgi:hypothetical protein